MMLQKYPSLDHKCWTRVEVISSDKHASLLRRGVTYGVKSFVKLAREEKTFFKRSQQKEAVGRFYKTFLAQ
jgi:hypothetical protein